MLYTENVLSEHQRKKLVQPRFENHLLRQERIRPKFFPLPGMWPRLSSWHFETTPRQTIVGAPHAI